MPRKRFFDFFSSLGEPDGRNYSHRSDREGWPFGKPRFDNRTPPDRRPIFLSSRALAQRGHDAFQSDS